jgi:hypothetical protein
MSQDTTRAALAEAASVIEAHLKANDPEGFGCACIPDKWLCGPCTAHKEQEPMRRSLSKLRAAIGDAPAATPAQLQGDAPQAPKPVNCRDAGPGKGYCDRCAAGYYSLCRYVLTVAATKDIDTLVDAAMATPQGGQT